MLYIHFNTYYIGLSGNRDMHIKSSFEWGQKVILRRVSQKRVPVIDNRRVEHMERMYQWHCQGITKWFMMIAKFVCSAFVIVLNAFSAFCVQPGLGIRFKDYV